MSELLEVPLYTLRKTWKIPTILIPMPTKEEWLRFMSYVHKTKSCWLWNGYRTDKGYGRFQIRRKSRLAHRVSFMMNYGYIEPGLVIDHLCENKSCVNPDHLQQIPHAENIMRENSNGPCVINSQKTTCPYGHPYDIIRKLKGEFHGRACTICEKEKCRKARRLHRDRINRNSRISYHKRKALKERHGTFA